MRFPDGWLATVDDTISSVFSYGQWWISHARLCNSYLCCIYPAEPSCCLDSSPFSPKKLLPSSSLVTPTTIVRSVLLLALVNLVFQTQPVHLLHHHQPHTCKDCTQQFASVCTMQTGGKVYEPRSVFLISFCACCMPHSRLLAMHTAMLISWTMEQARKEAK